MISPQNKKNFVESLNKASNKIDLNNKEEFERGILEAFLLDALITKNISLITIKSKL